jgi:hypothetical protein
MIHRQTSLDTVGSLSVLAVIDEAVVEVILTISLALIIARVAAGGGKGKKRERHTDLPESSASISTRSRYLTLPPLPLSDSECLGTWLDEDKEGDLVVFVAFSFLCLLCTCFFCERQGGGDDNR